MAKAPTTPRKRAFTHEQRVAFGKRIYSGEFRSILAASQALGIAQSQCRHYRATYMTDVLGMDPADVPASGKYVKAKASSKHLTVVDPSADSIRLLSEQVTAKDAQLAAMERDLDRAHEEVHTLQKLLMAVGKTL